ncbi:hypothetical protein MCAMS1_00709 [biofilm metagenome]
MYWGLVLLCLGFINPASALVDVPKLESPVTDLTDTLSIAEAQALESKLLDFEKKKGSQIAVLIVPTTQPEDIAEFGIKVADLWRIGRKGVDDGVIFIIAKDDRKFRLEVGYGLEGVIPDAVAKRITSEIVKPYFKNNDFVGGINAGVDQLIKLIQGEPLPEPESTSSAEQFAGSDSGESYIFMIFGGLFAGSLFSSLFGRTAGSLLAGMGTSAVATFIFGFGIAAILLGLIVFFFLIVQFPGGGGGWSNGGGRGGYYGGGSWGGYSSDSSSSSSWGGGGGGSFGGGGASDSW